jgi:hypothetical protein
MPTKFEALRSLAFCINIMIDDNISASIEEVETSLVNKSIIQFITDKQGGDLMIIYGSLPEYAARANELLYKMVIGEHNPVQVGRASRKWGIHNNGLIFLNALIIEVLTSDDFSD